MPSSSSSSSSRSTGDRAVSSRKAGLMLAALQAAANQTLAQYNRGVQPADVPPLVVLAGPAVLPDAAPGITFFRDVLLTGSLVMSSLALQPLPVSGSQVRAVLDLGGLVGALVPPPPGSGSIYMQQLTLRGLAVRPLPDAGSTGGGTPGVQQYALPLWAFSTDKSSSGSRVSLQLDSVTLVLPVGEYGVLYSAALRGADWRQGAASPLLAALHLYVPLQPPSAAGIPLAAYQGFGVNATRLLLVPEQPFDPGSLSPPLDPPAAGSEPGTSLSAGAVAGIVVAAVCGAAALVAAASGAAYFLLMQGRRAGPAADSGVGKPAGAACLPAAPPPGARRQQKGAGAAADGATAGAARLPAACRPCNELQLCGAEDVPAAHPHQTSSSNQTTTPQLTATATATVDPTSCCEDVRGRGLHLY
mmetsp:Transcript_2975/g.6494  ORF Transcript_2975/g.6494 Transcript_2975/m.6494 type:complete len:416 (-) Transcript_2975:9-1256(-)